MVSAPSPPLGRLQPRCSLDLRAGVGQGQSPELLTYPLSCSEYLMMLMPPSPEEEK